MRWRGRVEASALWFPPQLATPHRLAAEWRPGSLLLQARGGVLLLLPSPTPVRAENSAFLPLLKLEDGWSSTPSERPARDELVLLWQGEVWRGLVSELSPADLALLWDSSDLRYRDAAPLTQPRLRPLLGPKDGAKDGTEPLRDILPAVPAPAREQEEWLRRQSEPRREKRPSNPLLGLFDLLRSAVGQDQDQRYLSKMLDMFEKKQWDKALRHAIPLSQSPALGKALSSFRGLFRPRRSLDYTPAGVEGQVVGTSSQGMDLLRSVYLSAYRSLLEAGHYQEAAYVMGELLDDPRAAVEMLEEQKMYEEAARLATTKGLPADLQVRLWFRAGRVETAMTLARRHQVWAEAAVELERLDRPAAGRFRAAWAEDLVRLGLTAEGLEVGWSVRDQLPCFESWLEETLSRGGPPAWKSAALACGDSALSKKVRLGETLDRWFAPDGELTLEGRRAVLSGLRPVASEDEKLASWAGRTARSVIKQADSPFALGDEQIVSALIKLSGDPWLRVDAPRSLPRRNLRLESWRQRVERRGQLPLYDAAALGDDRTLVALGHAGLATLSRRGAFSQTFAQAAHQLVLPSRGDLYLTVSGRQLGFFQRDRVISWCSAQFDGFAAEHDGLHWMVWLGKELYRIDLAAAQDRDREWSALEQMAYLTEIRAVRNGGNDLAVLTGEELSLYRVPGMRLLSQRPYADRGPFLLTLTGCHFLTTRYGQVRHQGTDLELRGQVSGATDLGSHAVVYARCEDGVNLCLFSYSNPRQKFNLELPGATRARVRMHGQQVLVCDDQGRLLLADLRAQQWLWQRFL